MSDEEVLSTAFVATTITEADIIKGLLESNGIPAVVQGANMVSMLDGMVSGNKGIMVQVPGSRLQEAQEVIAATHQPVADDDEDFEAEDEED